MTSQLPLVKAEIESPYFTDQDLALLDREKVPRHVAMIMDGNRRWAKRRQLLPVAGHLEGVEVLMNTVKAAMEIGVHVLTVYAFSTENWSRPKIEVEGLMHLFESAILENRPLMLERGVRLDYIGDTTYFSPSFRRMLEETKEMTSSGKSIELVLALNYGGRDDIRRAVLSLMEDHSQKPFQPHEIDEPLLSSYLDTAKWPDPDLLIRTSGERRLSNFLLWQLSYAEVHVTDTLWPDFAPRDFLEALIDYQQRDRRLGAL